MAIDRVLVAIKKFMVNDKAFLDNSLEDHN